MSEGRSDYRLGIAALIGSNLLFALMAALVKIAFDQYAIDSYKMAVFRFAIGMGLLGLAAMAGRIELRFVSSFWLIMRGLLGGLGVLCLFLSISHLGVARGTVVSYTYPIFAVIGGLIILRERVSPAAWIGVAATLAGIVLIATDRAEATATVKDPELLWYVVAVVGAASGGTAVVLVRKLRRTDSSYAIFFSQCVMGLWITVIPANLNPVELSIAGGTLLVAIGITAASAQLLLTYGYAHVPIATGSVLGTMVPVLNAMVGFFIFKEAASLRSLVGIGTVIAACALVVIWRSDER